MNTPETPIAPPPAKRKRSRRLLAAVAGLAAILLAAGIGWLLRGHWQLQDAIAEADRLDPGWRWQELEARREAVPDEQNAMLLVVAAKTALPSNWPKPESFIQLWGLDPVVRLDTAQLQLLQGDLQAAAAALNKSRRLADCPNGRLTPRPSTVAMWTLCPEISDVRLASYLWYYEALFRAERQEPGKALTACRAQLNAGRAVGDRPEVIAMLVRIACHTAVLNTLERMLAQTESEEADLAAMQHLLEDEAAQPLLLHAARGERAMMDDLFEAFQSGRITGSSMVGTLAVDTGPLDMHVYRLELYMKNKLRRAETLRNNTRLVEIAKLPVEDQKEALERHLQGLPENPLHEMPLFGEMMGSGQLKWTVTFPKSQSRLRAMIALLAAERFRLVRGRWPNSLDELCPDFLHTVPLDPSDGKPLRLRRLPDGLVIYAIGADGKDHGGALNRRNTVALGTDYGFRLWNPNRRRQAAPPPFVGPPLPGDE